MKFPSSELANGVAAVGLEKTLRNIAGSHARVLRLAPVFCTLAVAMTAAIGGSLFAIHNLSETDSIGTTRTAHSNCERGLLLQISTQTIITDAMQRAVAQHCVDGF